LKRYAQALSRFLDFGGKELKTLVTRHSEILWYLAK
jgi:hypothetical protein